MQDLRRTIKTAGVAAIMTVAALTAPPAMAADAASYQAAYEAAEAARKKAASVGFEWRDTKKLLKKAKSAAEKGDFAKAEKFAAKAKFQGDAAYAQSQEQEEGWKAAVVR